MSIKENSTVIVSGYETGRVGEVVSLFSDLDIAIVRFEDGEVSKVALSRLTEFSPQQTEPNKDALLEGAKRISKVDFEAAIAEVTKPDKLNPDAFMVALAGIVGAITISRKLREDLFKDSDVIVMTADHLAEIVWDSCSPKKVSESVNNDIPISKALNISTAISVTLSRIVPILFSESYHD